MTGLTVSTTGSALPSVSGAAPSLLTVGAPSGVPGLAAFLDMMADQAAPATAGRPALPERQGDAEPGNSLPDQDDDQSAADPALAWLIAGMQITTPQAAPIALPRFQPGSPPVAAAAPQDAPTPALPELGAAPAAIGAPVHRSPIFDNPGSMPPTVTPILTLGQPQPATVPADPSTVAPAATTAMRDIASAAQPAGDPVKPRMLIPVMIDPARQPTPLATALNAARSTATSPVTAFAARTAAALPAMFALGAGHREERDGDTTGSPLLTGAALLQPADAARLIAQPGEMQRQTLDMSRQDWPQKMIDRIETLRDNADANDTSIRLKPEALGQIDVSIRSHADGAVSVKFTAEQPAARSLIADAQPQLVAAAEARGIRLSGTSVDLAGSGQGGNRQRPQGEPERSTSNSLAPAGDDITADRGGRIA